MSFIEDFKFRVSNIITLNSIPSIDGSYGDGKIWCSGSNPTVLKFTDSSGMDFVINTNSSGIGFANATDSFCIANINNTLQGDRCIAIGKDAASTDQYNHSIAIGFEAGKTSQGSNVLAGDLTPTNLLPASIAIGRSAGRDSQQVFAIAIGTDAGRDNQQRSAVAIGRDAGVINQGLSAVSLGRLAGNANQGASAVAIGFDAGAISQSQDSVAIGIGSGRISQGLNGLAIGYLAGRDTQGEKSIALGYYAGDTFQGPSSISLGNNAGQFYQGANSIAIGFEAGRNSQPSESIILNASAIPLDAATTGTFINPVRSGTSGSNLMYYDSITKEILYDTVKTFVIDHPNDPDRYLVHACLEGPEAGVYYRGTVDVKDGSVRVDLPNYINIARDFTVNCTPIWNGVCRTANSSRVTMDDKGYYFTIYCNDGLVDWVVYGKREDVIVEPLRSESNIRGDGPYRYL